MQTKLSLKMQTKIGPQLVMTSSLLRVGGFELERLVSRQLAENPALELVREGDGPPDRHFSGWPPSCGATVARGQSRSPSFEWDGSREDGHDEMVAYPSLIDQLIAQAMLMVDQDDLEVVIYLLQNLDQHGYLRVNLQELATELNLSLASIERCVPILHQLEPPGIGARDIRECFLIQCTHLDFEGVECCAVRQIIENSWDDFTNHRWQRIARKLRLSESVVENAWRFVSDNLYPYPLSLVKDVSDHHQTFRYADLVIQRNDHASPSLYTLEIPAAEALALRLTDSFAYASRVGSQACLPLPLEERAWLSAYLEQARLFMTALEQRWSTLRRIGEYLLDYQVEFLERGPRYLKPLTRAKVARALGLHESTVSRAISEKIIQLPDGRLIELNNFFDTALPAKEAIRQLLAGAPKPLSDWEIAEQLQAEGLDLARRTVAKYRRQLGLPSRHYQQNRSTETLAQGV